MDWIVKSAIKSRSKHVFQEKKMEWFMDTVAKKAADRNDSSTHFVWSEG